MTFQIRCGRILLISLSSCAFMACSANKGPAPGTPPGSCLVAEAQQCPSITSSSEIVFPPTLNEKWTASGELNTFSSPRAADLNGDCVDDIIIGHGEEGTEAGGFGNGYVTAHDGATGEELWRAGPSFDDAISLYELVGSPTLVNLNSDDIPDVVIGGREAALIAVDGATGNKIWQFDPEGTGRSRGWYNFYTTQPVDDINNDGIPDLVTANGGDALLAPFEEREPGHIMLLDGATGSIISSAQTPDGKETYMSPIVYAPSPGDIPYILFGTGGETFPGALWRAPLTELQAGDLSNAQQLTTTRSYKGVIAPPSLADLNLDGITDIVTVTFDGQVVALDGTTGDEIWHFEPSGYADDEVESYATPAIGYFNNDGVPDVFVSLSLGIWPQYDGSLQMALSGWDGSVIYETTEGSPGYPSPLAVDLNGDNIDEALIVLPRFFTSSSELKIIDFVNGQDYSYEWSSVGAGTPLIKDLDLDGVLDLVGCYASTMGPGATWSCFRKDLNSAAAGLPSWGGYLGTSTTGHFRSECPNDVYKLPAEPEEAE